MNSKNKTGILLLSHGSRLNDCETVINQIAEMYRETTENKVEIGFMEMRQPDIPTAIENLTKDTDINKIIVVPVFIAHGIHTKRDIPKILGIESEIKSEDLIKQDNHHHHHHHHENENQTKIKFDGEIVFTDPLGADPRIVEIIKERVDNA